MNWYKLTKLSSFGQKLDMMSKSISREFIEFFKKNMEALNNNGSLEFKKTIYTGNYNGKKLPEISLITNIEKNNGKGPISGGADYHYGVVYYKKSHIIRIKLIINNTTKISDILPIFQTALRHELQHYYQNINGTLFNIKRRNQDNNPTEEINELYEYFTDESEIDAYLTEAKRMCKFNKKDFKECLLYLLDQVYYQFKTLAKKFNMPFEYLQRYIDKIESIYINEAKRRGLILITDTI